MLKSTPETRTNVLVFKVDRTSSYQLTALKIDYMAPILKHGDKNE